MTLFRILLAVSSVFIFSQSVCAQSLDSLFQGGLQHLRKGEFEQSKRFTSDLIERSVQQNNAEFTSRGHYLMGVLEFYAGRYYVSIDHYQRAMETSFFVQSKQLQESVWNNIGVCFEKTGQLTQALEAYQRSTTLAEERGDSVSIAQSWINMGLLFVVLKDYDEAERFTQKARTYFESIKDTYNTALTIQNQGKIALSRKDAKKGLAYSREALKLFEAVGDTFRITQLTYNIGAMAAQAETIEQSNQALYKALRLTRQHNNHVIERSILHQLGLNFTVSNQFKQAEIYLNEAEALMKQHELWEYQDEHYQAKADLYAKSNNYPKYLEAIAELRDVQERNYQQSNQRIFQEMRVLYEQEKIKAENELLEAGLTQQKNRTKYLIIILIGSVVALFIISLLYVRVQRQMKVLYQKALEMVEQPSRPTSVVAFDDAMAESENNMLNTTVLISEEEERTKFRTLYESIADLMENERLYLNPKFSKSDLVQRMATNEKYVYQAIAQSASKNFNTFVNGFRVREAIRLLRSQHDLSNMDEVAALAGFNSKASFYRHFNEVTGLSPAQFASMHQKDVAA